MRTIRSIAADIRDELYDVIARGEGTPLIQKIRTNLEFVDHTFMERLTDTALREIVAEKRQGVPYSWEEYADL